MRTMLLKEFVAELGPRRASEMLGMSHPALIRAATSGRDIRVDLDDQGKAEAHEIKPFPSSSKKSTAETVTN